MYKILKGKWQENFMYGISLANVVNVDYMHCELASGYFPEKEKKQDPSFWLTSYTFLCKY